MYAILDANGAIEEMTDTLRGAVRAATKMGAGDVIVDAAAEPERTRNPVTDGAGAIKQLRTPYDRRSLSIPESALTLPLADAHERLRVLMPPFKQTGKTGIKRDFYPAGKSATLVKSILGQNAKTEKKKGHAENVDVQGLSLTPYWMFAETPEPAGLGLRKHLPNLCAGSSAACRHSCLVFAGQNYAADWSIYSKFQKTQILFGDPEAFGRVLFEACKRHLKNAPKSGYMPAVRLNVLSDVPWELVFPSLFESFDGRDGRPFLQFYDYTKVYGRRPPHNYDLTFSNSGGNLRNVKRQLASGGRVAVVAHVPAWRRGAPVPQKPGESVERYLERKERAVQELWSDRLPKTCSVEGKRISVIDGDVNDVRFLDPSPSIIALRWKDPGGQAASRAPEALRISQQTKFVVEIEEFCGLMIGAVTPSEQPDTTIQTVFSVAPLEANPSGRVLGTRRAGYGDAYTRNLARKLLF